MKRTITHPIICVLLAWFLAAGCQSGAVVQEGPSPSPGVSDCPQLAQFQGDVLVLLMGMPGCAATEDASLFLDDLHAGGNENLSLYRLDVPPPSGATLPPPIPKPAYPYGVDSGRETAETLNFFSYPTLYIFDRDGVGRYRGGCEPEEVKSIVATLLDEEPGAAKTDFSRKLPEAGSPAPGFEAATLDGKTVALDDLRGKKATLLVFSSLNCPFSKKAMACVPRIAADFEKHGASVAVVNSGADAGAIRSFYERTMPGVPVVVDGDGDICSQLYGVQTVPFFYVIDGSGNVAYRMSFNEESVREALDAALGLSKEAPKERSGSAG